MASSTKALPRASGVPDPVNVFSRFALEEAEDNKILRASLWFAVVFHTIMLLINFPNLEGPPIADPGDKVVHVYKIKRYRLPPPRPPDYKPPKAVKRVAVPDKTPHDPEPTPVERPRVAIDLELETDAFVMPEAPPPPPEPEGPMIVGGEVSKPVKISAPQPSYTELARRTRIQGAVVVQAVIDKQGDVTDVKVLKGLSMGLTEEAINAIRQWKFKPATLRGKPVDVYYNLTINFRLSS